MKTPYSIPVLLALCLVLGCSAQHAEERMAAPDIEARRNVESIEDTMAMKDAATEHAAAMADGFAADESLPTESVGGSFSVGDDEGLGHPLDAEVAMAMPSAAPKAPASSQFKSLGARKAMSADAVITRQKTNDTPLESGVPFESLPAGAEHHPELGFATVQVYYATDRQVSEVPLSQHHIGGNRDAVILLSCLSLIFALLGLKNFVLRRGQNGLIWGAFSAAAVAGVAYVMFTGDAGIEKRGVNYTADRGPLVRGICQVTVPDVHERGQVERPSLLRFEVKEDQKKHIVLTSATELGAADFYQRLASTVSESPQNDLLVFVHGYNVDFQSAVARTAQIAIDLPFEGVPVCYSWPSQASLFGYTVDETNAAWTQSDLKQFLTELVQQSGAKAINVIAHSMGNRPTTGAIVEMQREAVGSIGGDGRFLDRIVLAAPDVDADRFRRDLATQLSSAANQVTLYASSDDQALIASKKVHGYPRAGESGEHVVVVPGIETIDVSGIDLSLLGHSYYGDHDSMLRDLYDVVKKRLPAIERARLIPKPHGELTYWQLTDAVTRAASNQETPVDRK